MTTMLIHYVYKNTDTFGSLFLKCIFPMVLKTADVAKTVSLEKIKQKSVPCVKINII